MASLPDSKVHVVHMGPTWVLSAPDGPHVGSMNHAIRVLLSDTEDFLTHLYDTATLAISYGLLSHPYVKGSVDITHP